MHSRKPEGLRKRNIENVENVPSIPDIFHSVKYLSIYALRTRRIYYKYFCNSPIILYDLNKKWNV